MDNEDFRNAVELVHRSNLILITTHIKPDGDACGCLAALSESLGAIGKETLPLLLTEAPRWYDFVLGAGVVVLGRDVTVEQLLERQFDLVVILDTSSYSQLGPFEPYLKQCDKPVLVVDHHVTSDEFGDVRLVDSSAAATGLIVLDLVEYAGWSITTRIAEALFVAVASDTGWFQFANTDARTYAVCAKLVEAGARPTAIYDSLYNNFSQGRFNLMLAMLSTLELHFDGRFATQHISQRHFKQTGTSYSDTENLINECHRIETVEASALFVETEDGRIRCSLRSRGGIDVSEIAARYGGGGHRSAAGAYLSAPLEDAKQIIVREMAGRFGGAGHR